MERNPVLRAILPAPAPAPPERSGAGTPSASSTAHRSSAGAAGGSAGSPASTRRRRHVPAACASCRRRKIKCSAERPRCRQCSRLAVDCAYDTVGSETLGEARQRRLDELQARSSQYEELFHILQSRPDPDVAAIVGRIRQGARIDDVLRFVKEGDMLVELSLAPETAFTYTFPFAERMPSSLLDNPAIPYLNSLIARGTMDSRPNHASFPPPSLAHSPHTVGQLDMDLDTWNMYQIPYHAAELVDARIGSIKASRWTTVTTDDALVQRLMQIYFTFEFPYYTFFHKDHFLQDMVEGREEYCSSLLVNAVLAQACRGHQGLLQRFSFWNPQTLRNRFLAEVRRLWELESGQARVTAIQAASIMVLSSFMDTLDIVADRYIKEALSMAHTLGLFGSYAAIQSRRRRHVYSITAWGLFGLHGIITFHYRRPPTQKSPPQEPLPSYEEAPAVFGDLFVQYRPRCQVPLSCYHGEVARAAAAFRTIMVEVSCRSFGKHERADASHEVSLEDAISFHESLQGWYAGLPRPLTPHYIVLPAQLGLHLHYHNVLINLFVGLAATNPFSAQVLSTSKASIEALVRLYYLRHGFTGFDSTVPQFQWLLGEAAAEGLSRPPVPPYASNRDDLLSTLVLAAVGLRESGRYSFIAQGLLQVLQSRLLSSDKRLLGRFLATQQEQRVEESQDNDADLVQHDAVERYNQSNLPTNLFSMKLEPNQTLKTSVLAAAVHADTSLSSRDGKDSGEEMATTN